MPSLKLGKAALFVAVGLSFLVITTSASAKTDDNKYGWGYGDKNHIHIGPPGQSVVPIQDRWRIAQSNNSVSNLSVSASSITGGNSISSNSNGFVAIFTGAASTLVSIVNSLGQNIFGS